MLLLVVQTLKLTVLPRRQDMDGQQPQPIFDMSACVAMKLWAPEFSKNKPPDKQAHT